MSDNDTDTQVENSIRNLFYYAAWSDKLDGIVHQAPIRANTLAINEPIGVIAILCSDYMSFLSFVTILGLAISQGNRVVIIPSEKNPLTCLDFFQVIETSDIPDGVVNIISGNHDELGKVLAEHNGLDAIWCFWRKNPF